MKSLNLKNVSKIWKAKYNYNQPLQEVLFDDITWGGKPCRECLNQAKFKRYYELLEQDQLANPLLLHGKELWNGGLRLRVGIAKGYDGIDCIVSDDLEFLKSLTIKQQADAQNHFSYNALELLERIHVTENG